MSTVRFAILALLAEQPDCGYGLRRRFEDRVGSVWQVNHGQIYRTLRSLEAAALIHADGVRGGGRALRTFRIGDRGREALQRWLRRPRVRPQPLREEMLVRLVAASQAPPDTLLPVLEEEEQACRRMQRRLRAAPSRRTGEALVDVTRDLARLGLLLRLDAHLTWLASCRTAIRRALGGAYRPSTAAASRIPRPIARRSLDGPRPNDRS